MSFTSFQPFTQNTTETKPDMTVPKYLYRTEECGGSGVRDLTDIIKFEIFELGNTDILSYILENYDLKNVSNSFVNTIQTMEEICKNKNPDNSEALTRVVTAYGKTMVDKFVNSVIEMVKYVTQKDIKYGLWLASKKAVINYYKTPSDSVHCDASSDDIEMYETSDVILSNLGYEGMLFAYETLPNAIDVTTIRETERLENELNEILMEKNQKTIVENKCLERKENNVNDRTKAIFAKWSTIMLTMNMICKTLINDKNETNPLTIVGKYREASTEIYITGDNPTAPFVISTDDKVQIDMLNIGCRSNELTIKGSNEHGTHSIVIELTYDSIQYECKTNNRTMTTIDKIRCLEDVETLLIAFDNKFGKYVNMFIDKTRT